MSQFPEFATELHEIAGTSAKLGRPTLDLVGDVVAKRVAAIESTAFAPVMPAAIDAAIAAKFATTIDKAISIEIHVNEGALFGCLKYYKERNWISKQGRTRFCLI